AAVDHETEDDAGDAVEQGPVDQLAGDEGLVRHDDRLAVAVDDMGGADVDALDRAGDAADGDQVADAHRALEEDDQARDEVGEDRLQAEAQADRQRRHQPLQFVPADPEGAQGGDDADADQHVGQQRGGGVGAALGQLQARQHQDFQQAGQVARQGDGQDDDEQGTVHVEQADRLQDGGTGVFEQGDVVEEVEDPDQVGPDPVQAEQEGAEQGQADQAQRLLVDLLHVEDRFLHRDFRFAVVTAFGVALGLGALIG